MKRHILFSLACFLLASCTPVVSRTVVQGEAEPQVAYQEMEIASVEQVVAKPIEAADAPPLQVPGQVEVIGGDETALREFIERWLSPVYPGMPAANTTVWLASLPDSIPADMPLPAGARIVASVRTPYDTQIMLDTEMSPMDVLEFYAVTLPPQGWQASPGLHEPSGFVSAPITLQSYCLNGDQAHVMINALEGASGMTDLRLQLNGPADSYICAGQAEMGMMDSADLIPALRAPAGVQQISSGSGSGGDQADTSAELRTEAFRAADLVAHYNAQLQQTGWQMLGTAGAEGIAWSTWSFQDGDEKSWSGTLVVTESPLQPDRRFASLRISRIP